MKTMLHRFGLLLGLGALLAAGTVARGQEQTGTPGPSAGESSSAAEAATAASQPPRYVQLLNTNQVIALIRDNADKTPDGRRTLINAKKTLAAAQVEKAG